MEVLTCPDCEHDMEYVGNNDWECPACGCMCTCDDEDMEDMGYTVDDEPSGDRLSAYDAALIWRSHGCDEDYTCGYTEEELEEALG